MSSRRCNLGDIIVEDDDIHGDGVNVAARLEGIAEPGGIFVSGIVHDQVRDKLDLAFDDLGEQALKNIARPLQVYRVRSASPNAATVTSSVKPTSSLALPDKPSIAVLPFQNMSGDPEQEYFVDGMVEEIITALSRIRWLFVIARNSTFTYKGQNADVKQVGRELGVRYVLEGSVRKAGQRVRITGQLIDAETGAHLWADRFDGSLEDVFDLQDNIATSVAGVIEPALGCAHFFARRFDEAVPKLLLAIQEDPTHPSAYRVLAACYAHMGRLDDAREIVERLRAVTPVVIPDAGLEGLAEAGGICVSARVQEDAAGRLDLTFDDLGEQSLKNIARPVRVYRVRLAAAENTPKATLTESGPVLALPDKPSIAVLPFQNMSGDPEQEYFVDGMVEEIITALSRIRWLFVIARNSTFIYKGQAVDVKQVGRELGVRYVLEGSVRKAAGRVRITAQLIDAETGAHLWADRFDGSLEDVFDLQDKVAISVVGVIEPTLRQAEIERSRRKRPDSLDAYDRYLRALPFAFTAMPEDADKALALLDEAIGLEPGYAAAHAIIAWCHEQRYLRGGMHEQTKNLALHHARQAIAAGVDDAAALATAGFVIAGVDHDYETAINAFDRSFALSGSSALALGFSSIVRAWKGDNEMAVGQGETAIRLSPYDPLIYLPYVGLAYAHFASGRFEEAAAAASGAIQSNPRFSIPYALRAAAFASLGRLEDANAAVQRLLEVQPGITTIAAMLSARYANPESLASLGKSLRRAGLPE